MTDQASEHDPNPYRPPEAAVGIEAPRPRAGLRAIPAAVLITFGGVIVLGALIMLVVLPLAEARAPAGPVSRIIPVAGGALVTLLSGGLWVAAGVYLLGRRWWLMGLALVLAYGLGVVGASLTSPQLR